VGKGRDNECKRTDRKKQAGKWGGETQLITFEGGGDDGWEIGSPDVKIGTNLDEKKND